ncbi:hypothetical protein GF1_11700 [Desulfolithobacter dissulfuricans]|uniref:Uncharacterized protein n=1 Tax=Desulfolithobacter dissulfuricans TaxID=2795293 RepID=A0A915XHL2_9BACT|nr:hypothetical protein GF1_11700 [Desulfolithobacter dissulfuricans]
MQGLPCGGCGSTTYKKKMDGFQFPDGSVTDGWHCGGEHCGVKLFTGNKETDRKTREQRLEGNQGRQDLQGEAVQPRRQRLEGEARRCFHAAFPWLMEHLPELLAAGWTRPELFRRDKTAWPVGRWGVAWLSVWSKKNLTIALGVQGELTFSFPSSGRQIVQRTYPATEKKSSKT